MARLQVLLAFALLATTWAAPQFGVDDQPPTPYEFEYGVNVPETGDVKEHKESLSPSGRTEGEYRWLQPNGLFMVVRYYVDGDSGFVAEVSEEPGSSVEARYRNSLSQEAAAGDVVSIASSGAQSFAKSIDVVPTSNLGAAVNVISAPQPSRNRQSTFSPRPIQTVQTVRPIQTVQTVRPIQTFQPVQQQQQTFVSSSGDFNQQQSLTSGGFIDGGIIDGGIIDGGIIDGGIIDGGIINAGFDDSKEDGRAAVLAGGNRFQG